MPGYTSNGARRSTKTTKPTVILHSVVTCPECGYSTSEEMPTDSCLFFHECVRCRTLMRPKAGDCCVFCSYGSVKCPSVQLDGRCSIDGRQRSSL